LGGGWDFLTENYVPCQRLEISDRNRGVLSAGQDFWQESRFSGSGWKFLAGTQPFWQDAKFSGGARAILTGSPAFWLAFPVFRRYECGQQEARRKHMKLIAFGLTKLNTQDLFDNIAGFVTKLAANATDFPNPPTTDLTADQGHLEQQLGQLATLEAQVTAKRLEIDATCGSILADMEKMGNWLEDQTTDPAKLVKVAPLRSARTPSGPTPRVTNLTLSHGDASGEVDGAWNSLGSQGIRTYEIETIINPLNNDPSVGPWTRQSSVTKSKCTLTGFTSGARIWVRVRAVGPNGAGEWSDPATIIVP
jgi:hypothetical protein